MSVTLGHARMGPHALTPWMIMSVPAQKNSRGRTAMSGTTAFQILVQTMVLAQILRVAFFATAPLDGMDQHASSISMNAPKTVVEVGEPAEILSMALSVNAIWVSLA